MSTVVVKFLADDSGDSISFKCNSSPADLSIDNVSLKEVISEETPANFSVKEFLSGTTDEGDPIFFRVDTQQIQFDEDTFELFSNPIAVVSKIQRGSLVKCFVALDDDDFYEIQGTFKKGVSTIKIHSKDRKNIPTPPVAREIRISWRDSSKQLCRLTQSSIIFIPGTMDINE